MEKLVPKVRELTSGLSGHDISSIAVWGWPGDGKTCAILTAYRFLDDSQHGISLEYVKHNNELHDLEVEHGQNYIGIAQTTKDNIDPIADRFFQQQVFPAGTDNINQYIFRVFSPAGQIGHLHIADLPGGLYQEAAPEAQKILEECHACIITVNPRTYGKDDLEGKEYRGHVRSILDWLVSNNKCITIIITQQDKFSKIDKELSDTSEVRLKLLQESYTQKFSLVRTSVFGNVGGKNDADNPREFPKGNWQPCNLLAAWISTIANAFIKNIKEPGRKLNLNLHAAITKKDSLKSGDPLFEIRKIGDYSDIPGRALPLVSDRDGVDQFYLLRDSGALLRVEVDYNLKPCRLVRPQEIGEIPDAFLENWESGVSVNLQSEVLYLSVGSPVEQILCVQLGTSAFSTSLPNALWAWTVVGQNQIVGINQSGNLELLALQGNKWVGVDHVQSVVNKDRGNFYVFHNEADKAILVTDGESTRLFALKPGKFGDQYESKHSYAFEPNTQGYLGPNAEFLDLEYETLLIKFFNREVDLGEYAIDSVFDFSFCPKTSAIAFNSGEHSLKAALFSENNPVFSISSPYNNMDHPLTGVAWSVSGEIILVTQESQYTLFGVYGVD